MNSGLPRILVLGAASPYVLQTVEHAEEAGYQVAALVDNLGIPLHLERTDIPLFLLRALPDSLRQFPAVCCVGTPDYRRRVVAEASEAGITRYVTIVHPTAIISPSARIGVGCIISHNAVVGALVCLGDHVRLDGLSLVGHHSVIGEYVTICPGTVVGGLVHIESGAFIGLGAKITPRVRVGANSVVAAGSVVTEDVPPNTLVAGMPAVIKKEGISGYRG